MTVYGNYDVIAFKSCIQMYTVHSCRDGCPFYCWALQIVKYFPATLDVLCRFCHSSLVVVQSGLIINERRMNCIIMRNKVIYIVTRSMLFTNLQTKETYTAIPYKEVQGFAGKSL